MTDGAPKAPPSASCKPLAVILKRQKMIRHLFILTISLNLTALTVCGQPTDTTVSSESIFPRKADWTVSEVKKWVEQNKQYTTWHGWLLYQGSDSLSHHYISPLMDGWVWLNIKRTELTIVDERAYRRTSSAPLGYYYVDATKDFIKIKDY